VFPLVTGMVVDMTGSFGVALAIGAGARTLGALIIHTMVRVPIIAATLDGGDPLVARVAAPAREDVQRSRADSNSALTSRFDYRAAGGASSPTPRR
jgi:hypothetical protein